MKLIKCRIRGTRLFLVEKGDKFPENCCTPGYCTEIIPYKDNPPQCGRPVKYKIECCHDLDGIGTGCCYEYFCGYHVRPYLAK